MDKVFDKFYQIYKPHGAKNRGTGLGLAISKSLIEDAWGSNLGRKRGRKRKRVLFYTAHWQFKMKKRILIADDETSVVKVLIDRFNNWGYDVEAAYDGEETLEKVESFNPQLLILDIKMPKLGGMEVLEQTKKRYPQISIIILTASPSENTFRTCLEKGAADYILKPFNLENLRANIKKALTTRVNEYLS